ncbi:amidohydrolase family protein [Ferruginibacter paludis]|uniref:amidohydrolase family protein n=1 Tax=Ferruginibacter paludis TaxID=1310417 RepID=UPI0025B58BA0|nr:amidohydrolase family protein [Ferruginibacter paludis]MDN3659284.1 amidohydrolase family protein [Ferruginibacter paludis]
MYRKFTAHNIFNGYDLFPPQRVLITTPEGVVTDIVDKADAGDDIEFFDGLLTPGLINSHCHTELSYLKGAVAANTGLVKFVQQVMKSRGALDELKLEAIQQAEMEMYEGGIVAVGDICNTTDSIAVKQKSSLYWHNFIEVSGFVDAAATARLDSAKQVYNEFRARLPQAVSLSPHAPYSVSKTLFNQLNTVTANQLISIHNQECIAENDLYQNKNGDFLNLYNNFGINISGFQPTRKTSLQSWLLLFNNHQSILSVHNTFTSLADIDFYKAYDEEKASLYFCLCVNANQYIEQQFPPIDILRKNNCNMVIGTDSYASNWQLSILEEMKTIQQGAADVPLTEILQWATINGAQALKMDDELGSFEKNKKPGIVLIDHMSGLKLTSASTAKRIL